MHSAWLGEFLGTMILILLGDGVVAGVLLGKAKSQGAGWMVITAGWAFAVMAGVFTSIACGSADAHLNPAVTLGMAVRGGSFQNVLPYAAAQVLGAMAGATLV
jgi:glycerol uptake facilitator protein